MNVIPVPTNNGRTDISMSLPILVAALLVILCQLPPGHSYLIKVDTGVVNECFHERVAKGVKLGFSFEVIEGGFYDIDVQILGPNNVVMHKDDKTTNGKFTFEADADGDYNFCFSNKMSSQSPKSIIFDIDRSDALSTPTGAGSDGSDSQDETTKLKSMVTNLWSATLSSKHDVRYLRARDKMHRKISEDSNSRIAWWSAVEFFLLLGVSVGQVWYLKRFFEIRRRV